MRFLIASVCILFASALAGASAQLEKLVKTIGFCGGICVCAICARSATILQIERKSNKITVKSHTKSTLPRKLKTTSKKCRFESQNASQNRPRRPGRAPGPPPARDFRQQKHSFLALARSSVVLGWHRLVMSCEAATELSGTQRDSSATPLRSLLKGYHQCYP